MEFPRLDGIIYLAMFGLFVGVPLVVYELLRLAYYLYCHLSWSID